MREMNDYSMEHIKKVKYIHLKSEKISQLWHSKQFMKNRYEFNKITQPLLFHRLIQFEIVSVQ